MNPLTSVGLASVGWPVIDRFRLGDFAVSPHGLFIAIGFTIGALLFTRLAVRRGADRRACDSVVFWSLIGAIVGARVGYVIAHYSDFGSPLDWFKIWQGGISLLGGIAGATIANAVNIRRFGLGFFEVADTIAPALALGIAVGRIGDLIIADHLGKPTSWALAWVYKGGTLAPPFTCVNELCQADLQSNHLEVITRAGAELKLGAATIAEGVGVHQTALYDMLLAWVLFGVLWWFSAKDRRQGVTALLFAVAYGSFRLLEDSLRIDKRFGPLTGSQWTALTVVLVSLGIMVWFAVKKPPGPTTPSRKRTVVPDVAEPEEPDPDHEPATT